MTEKIYHCPKCGYVLDIWYDYATGEHIGQCFSCSWQGPLQPSDARPPVKRWQPYVSIDIETTGLDPRTCQVLEFGAVIDNWRTPVAELPRFQTYIKPDGPIIGTPYALALNQAILKKLSDPGPDDCVCAPDELGAKFADWLDENNIYPQHVTAAGKNFASFDLQFLRNLPGFSREVNFKHRSIDPAILFWNPYTDAELPNTAECLKRAGLNDCVAHTAIEDCISVIELVRAGARKCSLYPTAP